MIAQGTIPVLRLAVYIERCWHKSVGNEDLVPQNSSSNAVATTDEWYDVWRFDIQAVVSDEDSMIKRRAKEAARFVKNLFSSWASMSAGLMSETPDWMEFTPMGGSSIAGKLMKIAVVGLALSILKSPTAFFVGTGGAIIGVFGVAIAKVAVQVMSKVAEALMNWASEYAGKAGLDQASEAVTGAASTGWAWVKEHVGVDSRQRQVLRIGLTLSRPAAAVENAPWTQEYDLHYLGYTTLEMRVTVPGVVRVSALLAYVTDMNLSSYLVMLMGWIQGKKTNTRLDQCLACFACGKMSCPKEGPRGNYGKGEAYAFCADERSTLDMRKKINAALEDKVSDQCLKAQVADVQCAQPVSDGKNQPQRLLQIIEECQSLVPGHSP